MLKTDNTWKSGIISNGRYFTYRFLANGADAIASNYVTSCVIDECGASEHRLKAGEFCKNSIELTVLTNAYTKWRGGYIQIYVSCNGSAEVPLGKYWIYEQKLQDDGRYTKLTGYDVPEYMTEKADPASTSVAAIISAIESDSGMQVTNKNVFTLQTITAFPEGTTYMQLLGYIAGYDGYNLRTDRNGNIEAYRYTRSADILLVPKEDLFPAEDLFPDHREVNASDAFSGYVIPRRNTYIGSQSYAAEPISVNSIVVTNGSDTYTVGAGTSISYENPFITSADQIDKAYLGFSYVPIDNSWRGNPAVQIGDVLMVETSEGTFQTVLVMEQKLTLDGGFSATLSCYGETDAALASVESPTMREIKAAKKTLTDALLEALTTILGAGAGYFNFVDKDGNVITSSIQDATIAGWQITDSPTVTDSTKGWRFLLGGLYYSSNGFKTAKNFALTDEGQIVANSITTGTIQDAAGNNYWNLDTGDFRLSALTNLSTKVDTNTSSINSNTESISANTKDIQANTKDIQSNTKDIQSNTKDIQSNTKAIQSNAAELSNFITATYKHDITDLQNQIDGNISTWYYTGVPTLTNVPASQWTTQTDKDKHIGDLYYDKNTGYVYRFMLDNSVYKWIRITDEDIGAAMAAASKAQDTADGKRRVFVTQPVPPYDKGDLWCTGSSGDILTCMTAKASGGSYAASDWQKLNKYTDDSAVKALDNKLNSSEEIFNRLTNNGAIKGIYMQNGQLYINADFIKAGTLSGDVVKAGILKDAAGKNYWNMVNGEISISGVVSEEDAISSVYVEFAQNSSTEYVPSSGWSTSAPAWENGKYIWTRTHTVKANGEDEYSNPACLSGTKGDTGATGGSGASVKSITPQYILTSSNTSAPDSSAPWSNTQPAWSKDHYIWTRTHSVFTNGAESYSDPVLAGALNSANENVESLDNELNQEEILKRLTGGYTTEGLYIQNGHLYINGSAIRAGSISGDRVSGGVLKGATIVFDPDGNPVKAQRSAVGNGGVKFTGDGDFTIITQTVGITGKGTSSSEHEVQLVGKDANGAERCDILLTDSVLSIQKRDSSGSLISWVFLNDNGVTINGSAVTIDGSAVTINGMKAVTSNYSVNCQSGTYDGHTVLNFYLNGTYVGHTNY